ncbi:hypothetical protein F5887DRAFT_596561 [Amanita rubescens]|nr:hypothetical protein F5887DRAFT_596561 [Amanita rubescens]
MMEAIYNTHNTKCTNICARKGSEDACRAMLQSSVPADSRSIVDLPCWLAQTLLTLDAEHPLRVLLSGQDESVTSVYPEDYLGHDDQEGHAIFAYSPQRFSNPSVHRAGFHEFETGTAHQCAVKLGQEIRAGDFPPPSGSSDTRLSWIYDSEQARSYEQPTSMPMSFLDFQRHSLGANNPDGRTLPAEFEPGDQDGRFYGGTLPFSTPGPTSVWSFHDNGSSVFSMDDSLI